MSRDARFEEGGERPLRVAALDGDDIPVLSALVQDAVFTAADMQWRRDLRRFGVLLNRFRWEDKPDAEASGRSFERVRSVLAIDDVTDVASQGIDPGDEDTVLSLLSIVFEPGEDGTGALTLTLAGDGALRVMVECVSVTLTDVTRPYAAPSGRAPHHDL